MIMKWILILFIGCLFVTRSHADEFDSAGVKIRYNVTGEGDPVILIHGLTSSAKMNWDLPGITAELAKQHRVITLDCRGHGQSDKPTSEDQYGVAMVEDVVRLMDHLHIAKAQSGGLFDGRDDCDENGGLASRARECGGAGRDGLAQDRQSPRTRLGTRGPARS